MYQDHECFVKPENPDCKIWRYIDFTKFVDFLATSSLFFSRADEFTDPFEGSWPVTNIRIREERPELFIQGAPIEIVKQLQQITYRQIRKFVFINCWHINEYESAAMWNLYLKSNEGVAVQSTFNKLITSFDEDTEYSVHVGKVHYIDYERYFMPETNLFYPFLHKRRSFEHEKELRAIIMKFPPKNGGGLDFDAEPFEFGFKSLVDLRVLIDKIYVAPTAPKWIFDLIKTVLEQFSIDKEIVQSSLDSTPIY